MTTKADVTAADRLLKAAVKHAAAIVCDGPFGFIAAEETLAIAGTAAEETLAIAGTAAELLLDGAA